MTRLCRKRHGDKASIRMTHLFGYAYYPTLCIIGSAAPLCIPHLRFIAFSYLGTIPHPLRGSSRPKGPREQAELVPGNGLNKGAYENAKLNYSAIRKPMLKSEPNHFAFRIYYCVAPLRIANFRAYQIIHYSLAKRLHFPFSIFHLRLAALFRILHSMLIKLFIIH